MTVQYSSVPAMTAAQVQFFNSLLLFQGDMPADVSDYADYGDLIATAGGNSGTTISMIGNSSGVYLNNSVLMPVVADGTITHFRFFDSYGDCTCQGTVSLPDGGGDMILDQVDVVAGQVISLDSINLTVTMTAGS